MTKFRLWNEIHPKKGFQPDVVKWVHLFKEAEI